MEELPYDIMHNIIYDKLDPRVVNKCLQTSRAFHILTAKERHMIKCIVKGGMMYCIINNCLRGLIYCYKHKYNTQNYSKVYLFEKACEQGHIQIIKWMLDTYGTYIFGIDYVSFRNTCIDGKTKAVQWLIKNYSENLQSFYKDKFHAINNIVLICCGQGYLDIIKILINTFKNIDIHFGNDYMLCLACKGGYINVLKYLIEIHDQQCKKI